MRALVLLGLLLTLRAAPAEAQNALSDNEEATLFGTAALVTVGGTYLLIRATEWTDSPVPLYALPLVPIAATCAIGSALHFDGSCGRASATALRWSIPGYALLTLGLNTDTFDGLGYVALGGLWLVIVPPVAALEGYRSSVNAMPAVLSDPASHRLAPGVQLRIGF